MSEECVCCGSSFRGCLKELVVARQLGSWFAAEAKHWEQEATDWRAQAIADDAWRASLEQELKTARDELIEVVTTLERGVGSLDESLRLWERGEKLAKHCEAALAGARRRIEDALAAAEGVEPTGRQDEGGMGRFAWLMDPAGVKIELWEPPAADAEA